MWISVQKKSSIERSLYIMRQKETMESVDMWMGSVDNLKGAGIVVNIFIISVGKIKEKYLKQGIAEYEKRMSPMANMKIIELADEKTPDRASEKEKLQIKQMEGERILSKIQDNMYVIALEPRGNLLSSEEIAYKLDQLALHGKSKIAFIIGGSLGLDEKVLKRADFSWSFSALTFPHQLMRLMLMEQVYRAFQINRGSPYHK